jgi:hypothetical protein
MRAAVILKFLAAMPHKISKKILPTTVLKLCYADKSMSKRRIPNTCRSGISAILFAPMFSIFQSK